MSERPDSTASVGGPGRTSARPACSGAAAIDGGTGLASDFLNQFNEVVMLLDLAAAGDEALLGELDAWRPSTYEAYFTARADGDSPRIVDSYRGADAAVRRRLDALAGELSALLLAGIVHIMSCRDDGPALTAAAAGLAAEARTRLDALGGIVHAGARAPTQAEVSALFRRRAA